jgi:hypothetical protein
MSEDKVYDVLSIGHRQWKATLDRYVPRPALDFKPKLFKK